MAGENAEGWYSVSEHNDIIFPFDYDWDEFYTLWYFSYM